MGTRLRHLAHLIVRFTATCAAGCGRPVPAGQVMCPACATK
ncbi:hypothetical protein [Amycolatopsis cihanbeyliensis]|nr:hypothetical protein [Amycolatopsis cihanbeyliensis]